MSLTYHNYVCECGCGELVLPGSRFVNGHWINICNPMKLEIARKKNSESQTGKPREYAKYTIHSKNCQCSICKLKRRNPEELNRVSKQAVLLNKDLKIRKKRSFRMLGENNPSKNLEVKKKQINFKTKQWLGKEYRESMTGENSPTWKGGISFDPYPSEFTEELKEYIRNRDNRICQICSKTEEENERKLEVHHIDYNKSNLEEYNLISLCKSCHAKTNHYRNSWLCVFAIILILKGYINASLRIPSTHM